MAEKWHGRAPLHHLGRLDFEHAVSMITGTAQATLMTFAIIPGILCHDVRCSTLSCVFFLF